jgi:hypothetical protein
MANDPYADLLAEQPTAESASVRKFISPVSGVVGGGYHDKRDHGKHAAGDLFAPAGDPVVAPGDMEFIQGRQGGSKLRDNDWWSHWRDVDTGVEYRFAHHGPIANTPGDVVRRGEQWNVIGDAIDDPHLHMAVHDPVAGKKIDWVSQEGLKRGKRVYAGTGFNDFEERASKIAATVKPSEDPYADLHPSGVANKDPYADLSAPGKVDVAPSIFSRAADFIDKTLIQKPGSAKEASTAGMEAPGAVAPPVLPSPFVPQLQQPTERKINTAVPPGEEQRLINEALRKRGIMDPEQASPEVIAQVVKESGLKFTPDQRKAEPAPGTYKSLLDAMIGEGVLFKRAYDGQMVPFQKLHPIEQREWLHPSVHVEEAVKGVARGISSGLIQPPPGPMGESWGKGELRPIAGEAGKLGEQAGGLAQFGAALIPGAGIGEMAVESFAPLMVKTLAGRVAKSGVAGGVAGSMTEGLSQAVQGKDFTAENLQKIASAGANAAADLMLLHYGTELAIPWVQGKIALSQTSLEKTGQSLRDAYYRNVPDWYARINAKGGLPDVLPVIDPKTNKPIIGEAALIDWFKTHSSDERTALIRNNPNFSQWTDASILNWYKELPKEVKSELINSNPGLRKWAKEMQRGGHGTRSAEKSSLAPEVQATPGMVAPQPAQEPVQPGMATSRQLTTPEQGFTMGAPGPQPDFTMQPSGANVPAVRGQAGELAPKGTFQTFIAQTGGHQADPAVLAHDFLETQPPGWALSPEGLREATGSGGEVKRLHKELALVYGTLNPELAKQMRPDEIWRHLTPENMEAIAAIPRGKLLLDRLHAAVTDRMAEAQGELQVQEAEVQQQAAEEAAVRAQAPPVDKSRPAAGTLFTPEQIKNMTHAEYEALPPEQQKRFDRDVKAYEAEKEKKAPIRAEKNPALRKVAKTPTAPPAEPKVEAGAVIPEAPKPGEKGEGERFPTKDEQSEYDLLTEKGRKERTSKENARVDELSPLISYARDRETGRTGLRKPEQKKVAKPLSDLDILIPQYKDTGRVVHRYPRKKQVSLDGRTMSEADAIQKMKEVLGITSPTPAPKPEVGVKEAEVPVAQVVTPGVKAISEQELKDKGLLRLKTQGYGKGKWYQFKDADNSWTTTHDKEKAIAEASKHLVPTPDLTAARALRDKFGTSRKVGKPDVGIEPKAQGKGPAAIIKKPAVAKMSAEAEPFEQYSERRKQFRQDVFNKAQDYLATGDGLWIGSYEKAINVVNSDAIRIINGEVQYYAGKKGGKYGGVENWLPVPDNALDNWAKEMGMKEFEQQPRPVAEQQFAGLEPTKPTKVLGKLRKKPVINLDKAIEDNNIVSIIQYYGGIDPKSYDVTSNFNREQQRTLRLRVFRKGGFAPDVIFTELKNNHPDQFLHFTDSSDMLTALVDGRAQRMLTRGGLEAEVARHAADIEAQAEDWGITPEELLGIEADVEREILAEREAIKNEGKYEVDLDDAWWTGEPAEPDAFLTPTRKPLKLPKLTARLDKLQEDYPGIDRDRAAVVIRALPNAEDGQIANMSADPEMFNQVAKGNLSASAKAQLLKNSSDASQQGSLLGEGPQGGLFGPKYTLKQARALAPTFYSQMATHLETKLPGKGTGADLANIIEGWATNGQFKVDELKFSGLLPWLREQTGPVMRHQIIEKLKEGEVRVEVVERGNVSLPPLEWESLNADNWIAGSAYRIKKMIGNWEVRYPVDYKQVGYRGVIYNRFDTKEQAESTAKILNSSPDWKKEGGDHAGFKVSDGGQFRVTDENSIKYFKTLNDAKNQAELWEEGKAETKKGTKFQSYLTDLPESFTNRREMLLTVPYESKFDPSKVKIERDRYSTTQGQTIIYYDGKLVKGYQDNPELSNGKWEQKPEPYWMDVAKKLYEQGDKINRVPQKGDAYTVPSGHAYGDPAADVNRFAHVFLADYVDPKTGKKSLVVTELQSDWAAAGRKGGYIEPEYFYDVTYDGKVIANGFTSKADADQWIKESDWEGTANRQNKKIEVVQGERNKSADVGKAPPLPFAKNWHEVALKQLVRKAAEEGYDGVMVVNGEMVFKRWGSEAVAWRAVPDFQKKGTVNEGKPAWMVGATEQVGGIAGGTNIEEAARAEGILKETEPKLVTTKEQLRRIVRDTLSRERTPVELDKLTDRIWERMQIETSGTSMPRKEFFELNYGTKYPNFLKKYVKQWGAEVGRKDVETFPKMFTDEQGFQRSQENIEESLTHFDIPQSMKDSVLYRGQPLYKPKEIPGEKRTEAEAGASGPVLPVKGRDTLLPQDAAGQRRQLESVKSRVAKIVPAAEYDGFWRGAVFDGESHGTPEHVELQKYAAQFGINYVIPVKGAGFDGAITNTPDGPVILIDRNTSTDATKKQITGHEIFHGLIKQGDPEALRLVSMVDINSPVFKKFQEAHNEPYRQQGIDPPAPAAVAEELAGDFFGGIKEKLDINGNPFSLKEAFRSPTQAFEVKAKINGQARRGVSYMAKRGPPGGKKSGADRVWETYDKNMAEFDDLGAWKLKEIHAKAKRMTVDTAGNLKRDLLKQAGNEGRVAVMMHEVSSGASLKAKEIIDDATKRIYKGLSKADEIVLNKALRANRDLTILNYKPDHVVTGGHTAAELQEALATKVPQHIMDRVKEYSKVMDENLDTMKEAGLLTDKGYGDLKTKGDYLKTNYIQHIDPDRTGFDSRGRKITVPDSGIKKLDEGSSQAVQMNSRILMAEVIGRTQGRISRNNANEALYQFITNNPDNPFGFKLAKVYRVVKNKETEISWEDAPPDYDMTAEVPPPKVTYRWAVPTGHTEVSVMREGKRIRMVLPNKYAQEWVQADPMLSPTLATILGWLSGTKVLKALATGMNPGFALTNLPRDIAHIWLVTNEYSTALPAFGPQMATDLATVFLDTVRRTGRYRDMIDQGGGMGFLTQQGQLKLGGSGPLAQVQKYLGWLGETSEIWTRLAVRERAIKNGKSPQEATWIARNYLDFAQGGSFAKAADTMIPYLNAGIQGTRKVFQAASDTPGRFLWKIAQIGAIAIGLYLANSRWNKDAWDEVPEYEKRTNWIITTPIQYKDKDGNTRHLYFRIAKDQGQRAVAALFEAFAAKMTGDKFDYGYVVKALGDALPLMPFDKTPPAFNAGMGYYANIDFWCNEQYWRGPKVKPSAEWNKFTHPLAVEAGKYTGLSPARLQGAFGQLVPPTNTYAGLVGAGIRQLMDPMTEKEREKSWAEIISNNALLNKLVRPTSPYEPFKTKMEDAKIEENTRRYDQKRKIEKLVEDNMDKPMSERNRLYFQFAKEQPITDRDRLINYARNHEKFQDIPNRKWWVELKHLPPETAATMYWGRYKGASPEEQKQLYKQLMTLPGVKSDRFMRQFIQLKKLDTLAK